MGQYIFLSYVSEDEAPAMALAEQLRAYGIDVWTNKNALRAGDRWRDQIARAISQGGAFLACFSASSEARSRSYMREELALAIGELRLRSASRAWFIPVLIDGTPILDDAEIGAGMRLSDIHFIDMTQGWEEGVKSIVASLLTDHAPAERARLESELRMAKALERLAVGTNIIPTDPVGAISAIESTQRVPYSRAVAYVDHLEERFAGVQAILELKEMANRFGATHLASNPLAVAKGGRTVAWSSRSGAIAVADLRSETSAQLLGNFENYAADLFLDAHATTLIAVYFHARRILRWIRTDNSNWILSGIPENFNWRAMMPYVTTRYAGGARELFGIEERNGELHLLGMSAGRVWSLPFGQNAGTPSMSPDMRIICTFDRREKLLHFFQLDSRGKVQNTSMHPFSVVRDIIGWAGREAYPAPHGIRVDVHGNVLLDLSSVGAVLRDPFADKLTKHNVDTFSGWSATLLPNSADIISMDTDSRGVGVTLHETSFSRRKIARLGSTEGLRWSAVDSTGTTLAVADERGRAVAVSLPGGARASSRKSLGAIPYRAVAGGTPGAIAFQSDQSTVRLRLLSRLGMASGGNQSLALGSGDGKILSISMGRRFVVATEQIQTGLQRLVWDRATSTGGEGPMYPCHVKKQTLTADQLKQMNAGARVSQDGNWVAWELEPGVLEIVDLRDGSVVGHYRFIAHKNGQRVWDFSEDDDIVCIFGFSYPVQVRRASDGYELAELLDTGGGMGGAWGDWPADIRIAQGIIVATKRAGSVARWRVSDFSPIGRPVLIYGSSGLGESYLLPDRKRDILDLVIPDIQDGIWILRDVHDETLTINHWVGGNGVLASYDGQVLVVRNGQDQLESVDLSYEAGFDSMRRLVKKCAIAE